MAMTPERIRKILEPAKLGFRGLADVVEMNGWSFLGEENITHVANFWEDQARLLAKQRETGDYLSKIEPLKGKTIHDIRAMAAEYENPEFPEVGMLTDGPRNWLVPLDEASRKREDGATTLNVCGWCRYAKGIKVHDGCKLTCECEFVSAVHELQEYQSGKGASGVVPEFRFDSRCALTNDNGEILRKCRTGLKFCRNSVRNDRRAAAIHGRDLARLAAQAESKPLFPAYRPTDYFHAGDRVVVYTGAKIADAFVPGMVICDCEPREGYVTIRLDTGENYGIGGFGLQLHMDSPEIILVQDIGYLKSHRSYLDLWWRCHAEGATEDDFDGERFAGILTRTRKWFG